MPSYNKSTQILKQQSIQILKKKPLVATFLYKNNLEQ